MRVEKGAPLPSQWERGWGEGQHPLILPLLLDPDVGEIDPPGAGNVVMEAVTVGGVRLREVEHRYRLLLVDDVTRLDQQVSSSLLVEGPLRLSVDLVELGVAVLHVVEADLVLITAEHRILKE